MKALSIRQPWAYAIVHEGKDIENRTWPTKYRGPLAIHAAARPPYKEINAGISAICAITGKHENDLPHANSDTMLYGGIIGVCDIVDCVAEHPSPWFSGRYGFALANVRPVPFFQCGGQLSLFNVDVTLEQLTATPKAKPQPVKIRTIADLIKANKRLQFKCHHCKATGVIDVERRSTPRGATIRGAALFHTCTKCGSPNIRTYTDDMENVKGALTQNL